MPSILHADLDAFFASVEQRDDPALRGRPLLVGGGVVVAASYEAKARGVRPPMGGAQARRACPEGVVVSPRWPAYVEASRQVFAVLREAAPEVEAVSIDEAFLDVSGLERISGTGPQIAARLRAEVRERCGLPISIGVARTRLLAKIASGEAKPDGLRVIAEADEAGFLETLPVERVWGIGPATAGKLHRRGVRTVGEARQLPEVALTAMLGGATGRWLYAFAHGRPARPRGERRTPGRRSIGAQSAMGRGPHALEEVDRRLLGLCDKVCRRARADGFAARTVVLRLRFGDFERATRSRTLLRPSDTTAEVVRAARGLLRGASDEVERRGITLVGITLTNLERGGGRQLGLPLERGAGEAVDRVLDDVRDRFGAGALQRATLVGERALSSTLLDAGVEREARVRSDRRPRREGSRGPTAP